MRIEIWSLRTRDGEPPLTEPLEIFKIRSQMPAVPRIGDAIATPKMPAGRVEDVKWMLPDCTVRLFVR